MRRERGWNFTVHGVRSWPVRTARMAHDDESNTLTVWSPCVEAKYVPSVEKARAIVDLAPLSAQYPDWSP